MSKHGAPAGRDRGGISSVERLMQHCVVDVVTGCWRVSAMTVWVRMPDGSIKTMRPRRAAAVLAFGHDLRRGTVAFRALCCAHDDCANPDHTKTGNRAAFMRANSALGRLDTPARRAVIAKSLDRSKTTPEQRVAIANSREKARVLAERFGISVSRVNQLRSAAGAASYRARTRVASIFEWRPA